MEDLGKKVLERLQRENIRPITRWRFVCKRIAIWTLFIVSIGFGSLACGILIYQMDHVEWGLLVFQTQSPIKIMLSLIPYLWLSLVIAFISFALYNFRHTTKGYRQRPVVILIFSVMLSLGGGYIGYAAGLSSYLDDVFERHIPAYQGWEARRVMVWMNPEDGLLAGEISEVEGVDLITLTDMHGKTWLVDVENAIWRGWTSPQPGIKIKLLGRQIDESNFKATEIRPWYGRRWRRWHGPGRGGHYSDECPRRGGS